MKYVPSGSWNSRLNGRAGIFAAHSPNIITFELGFVSGTSPHALGFVSDLRQFGGRLVLFHFPRFH